MKNDRWLWGRALLAWLTLTAFCTAIAVLILTWIPTLPWVWALVIGILVSWILITVLQRRAYADSNAETLLVEEHALVTSPQSEVFEFMADVRNDPRYSPQVIEVTMTSPGPLGVGDTYREKIRVGSRLQTVEYVVVAHDPPKHLAVIGRMGYRTARGSFTLAAAENNTLVTLTTEIPVSVLNAPFGALYARAIKRQTQDMLCRLQHELGRKP